MNTEEKITAKEVCEILLKAAELNFADSMEKASLMKTMIENDWCEEFLKDKYKNNTTIREFMKRKAGGGA